MDPSDVLINFLDSIEYNPKLIPASNRKLPRVTEEDLNILEYYFDKPISWLKDVVFKIMARDLPQYLNYDRISYFLDSSKPELKELANALLIIKNTGNGQEEITETVNKILI